MKKAKVFLTAVAVFAVVGGALAFKAQKLNGNLYCAAAKGEACIRDEASDLQKFVSTTGTGIDAFCTLTNESDDCTGVQSSIHVTTFQ